MMDGFSLTPVDVETVLPIDLAELMDDAFVFGPPVPSDLGAHLPAICVSRTGGYEQNLVIHDHYVTIDCWAPEWVDAMEVANRCASVIQALPYCVGLDRQYLSTQLTALPYDNTDPRHLDLPRVSFAATVTLRALA